MRGEGEREQGKSATLRAPRRGLKPRQGKPNYTSGTVMSTLKSSWTGRDMSRFRYLLTTTETPSTCSRESAPFRDGFRKSSRRPLRLPSLTTREEDCSKPPWEWPRPSATTTREL